MLWSYLYFDYLPGRRFNQLCAESRRQGSIESFYKKLLHSVGGSVCVPFTLATTSKHSVPDIVLGESGLATLRLETYSYGAGTKEWIGSKIPLSLAHSLQAD